ncbi:addiction module protein [Flavobacterium sp. GSA192]|uniref:addiction module protein n=1 Tax=Flavobacterium sp. GSA192 TaxID=2576304 RepID=UPI00112B7646|nr:addiction module protein [Flavobacterium sp. GSA192]
MQSANLQKDKLELIEKIIHTEDQSTLDFLKDVFIDDNSEYKLTEEQKLIIEEATAKYYSGEDPGLTWEQVKNNARKRNFQD